MEHKIIIPNFLRQTRMGEKGYLSKCLIVLPLFDDSISVISDNDVLNSKVSHILDNRPAMANKNGSLASLFMIDDHVFMTIDADNPTWNSDAWIPHYSKYVSGFFVNCNRHSTAYIFKDYNIPVLSLGLVPDHGLPTHLFEHNAHSEAMTNERDISVFFRGRYITRVTREYFAHQIQEHIPGAHVSNSGDAKRMPGATYVNLMGRSKIAWCPRSVKAPPDYECNAVTGRDSEAMCLECLVVRPSIGVIEIEERFSGVHFVEYTQYHDGSDLIEKLQYYLEHEDERKEIAYNGRLWWERNCSSTARAKRIFLDCLNVMGCNYEF